MCKMVCLEELYAACDHMDMKVVTHVVLYENCQLCSFGCIVNYILPRISISTELKMFVSCMD